MLFFFHFQMDQINRKWHVTTTLDMEIMTINFEPTSEMQRILTVIKTYGDFNVVNFEVIKGEPRPFAAILKVKFQNKEDQFKFVYEHSKGRQMTSETSSETPSETSSETESEKLNQESINETDNVQGAIVKITMESPNQVNIYLESQFKIEKVIHPLTNEEEVTSTGKRKWTKYPSWTRKYCPT